MRSNVSTADGGLRRRTLASRNLLARPGPSIRVAGIRQFGRNRMRLTQCDTYNANDMTLREIGIQ
jgi:hypothetical protein